ncbi:MAG TPA: RsmB/NOP family class I SAM-dependent RNA methyltransferase [Acidimicrobiia bacterium]|nr:RsmB/NOP family class I SAM-dependent RNA methyltransferase [Acidimicrobiia bacterium]
MTRKEERLAAARAVGRVIRSGAWSNVVSRTEAASLGAEPTIVQALVLAVLRHRPLLDREVERHAGRSLDRIDPVVCDLLRVGAAEAMEGRMPAPLIVDGIVHAARAAAPRAVGFVNAVMRRLAEDPPVMTGPGDGGVPEFVDQALRHVLEGEAVDAFWEASRSPAPVGLRSGEGVEGADAVEGIPSAWLWREGAPPPGVAIQDPASVAVGNALDARPGWQLLDMGAAPGGKTAHLIEQVGPEGRVVALDRHRRRVETASRRVPGALWVVGDGTRAPFVESHFDAVLVDAPCTGLGTLRRRPELSERVTPDEMARLAAIQRAMLDEALRIVRPGGRVVYSVCTITPAETIDVVAGLGARAPEGLPGVPYGDGWLMAPHLGPTDGMFVAVFER